MKIYTLEWGRGVFMGISILFDEAVKQYYVCQASDDVV